MAKFIEGMPYNNMGKEESRQKKCYKCGKKMTAVSGMMTTRDGFASIKYGFRCASCGKIVCYDCADRNVPCKCKHTEWFTFSYVEK
jgi:hypothetical protein